MFAYVRLYVLIAIAAASCSAIRYLGCYVDTVPRVLDIQRANSNSNSPQDCANRCHGFTFSGTEVTYECYCGNSLVAARRPDSECWNNCSGDSRQKCGAEWRLSVYVNN